MPIDDDEAQAAGDLLGIDENTTPGEIMGRIMSDPEAQRIAMDLARGVASEHADDETGAAPKRTRGRPRKPPGEGDRPPAPEGAEPAPGVPRSRPGGAAPPPRSRQTAGAKVGRALGAQIAMTGGLVAAMADDYVGSILIERGPDLGEAWGAVAEVNPRVRRIMETMVAGGVYSQAAMATAAVVIPIAAHYGLLPAKMANAFGSAPTDLPGPPMPPPPTGA